MSTGGVRDLFRSTRIRETTIIIMLNQFVRGIINYGFLFNIGGLGGNIYYNNIINNLTGIPAFLMLCCTGLFFTQPKHFGRCWVPVLPTLTVSVGQKTIKSR